MDRDQARRYVKERMEDYLTRKGLNLRKPFNCLNPEHPDKKPSMSFDRRRNKVHCFACGADYDIFDLIGLDYGLREPAEIFQKAYEIYEVNGTDRSSRRAGKRAFKGKRAEAVDMRSTGAAYEGAKPDKDYAEYYQRVQARLAETDYPEKRGLSLETCRRFGLGYDPEFAAGKGGETWRALIIPTGPGSYTARNTDPAADDKNRIRKRGGSPVFNAEALWSSDRPVFVVEGEIDALSLEEVGGPAVALGSTANVGAFLKIVESRPPTQALLLTLDNDEGGRRAADSLKEGLNRLSQPFYEVDLYGDSKDANEALLKDYWTLVRRVYEAGNIEEAAREAERRSYLETSALFHLPAFKNGIAESVDTRAQATGFAALDAALDGGLYEGLYIMGGISSLGKTSLALQLADQLAEAGRDVLIFSLEMARPELMAKSLSRLTLLNSLDYFQDSRHAKTGRGITSGGRYRGYGEADLKIIEFSLEYYETFAGRVFISEGVGEIGPARIRREVEKHLRHTGRDPVVFVDYLQILAPFSDRATDKQNTDKSVLELKRLSRDFKIPVVAVSSFNRANYREAVTMEAFKESGAIEYSSDVLLGLQLKGAGEKDFDAGAAKEKNPRQVELVILKNRHGPAGVKIGLEYYPLFNYFRETR